MEKLGGAPSILDVHNKINELVDAQNAEVPVEVPTKVSDLENDAGYITASVNTLANYYTKGETYTKTEVDGLVSDLSADITTLQSTVLKNSGNQTLNGNLTVTGNTVVQGNLTVQGTTITKDAESLVVQDNVIVTNSNGTTLTDLSGLFIKTGATGGYAVVYDPTKDAVILGEGTIDGSNVVTIQASERKAIVTRQDGDTFTDKNIVMWDAEHNGLVDSGMTRSMIALRGSANTFSALQTFSAGISVNGSIVFGEHTLSAPIGDGQIARMSDIPTKLPNPAALTFGTTTYDGSAARTITADSLGALTQATADGLYQSRGNYTVVQINGVNQTTVNFISTASTMESPDGTYICFIKARWGATSIKNNYTVTFPEPFFSPPSVVITPQSTQGVAFGVNNITTTSASLYIYGVTPQDVSTGVNIVAIGRTGVRNGTK